MGHLGYCLLACEIIAGAHADHDMVESLGQNNGFEPVEGGTGITCRDVLSPLSCTGKRSGQ